MGRRATASPSSLRESVAYVPASSKSDALQETVRIQRGSCRMPMKPENVKSVADAKKIVEEQSLTHVKVAVFDGDAIMRGKYMSMAKFFSALENNNKNNNKKQNRDSHD